MNQVKSVEKIIEKLIEQDNYSLNSLIKQLKKNDILLTDREATILVTETGSLQDEIKEHLNNNSVKENIYYLSEPTDENLRILLDTFAEYSGIYINYEDPNELKIIEDYDGSQLLFKSLNRYPVLTEKKINELYQEYKKGNAKAREQIICSNQRLVLKIANQYNNKNRELQDLFQIGVQGLIEALDYYNPDKNSKFSTYATWHIRKEIENSIRENEYQFKTSHDFKSKLKLIKKCIEMNYNQNGVKPTIEEIQAQTGLSIEIIKETIACSETRTFSFNEQINDESESTYATIIKDDSVDIEKEYESKELIEFIIKELGTFDDLSVTEIEIFKMNLGIGYSREYTLTEIGKKYSITCERVRQITNKVKKKVKIILSDNYKSRISKQTEIKIKEENIPLFSILLVSKPILLEYLNNLSTKEIELLKLKYTLSKPSYKKRTTNEENEAIEKLIQKIKKGLNELNINKDDYTVNSVNVKNLRAFKTNFRSYMNNILYDLPLDIQNKYLEILNKPLDEVTKIDLYHLFNVIMPYATSRKEALEKEINQLTDRINNFIRTIEKERIKNMIETSLNEDEFAIYKSYVEGKCLIGDLRKLGNEIVPRININIQSIIKDQNYRFKNIKFYLQRNQNQLQKISNNLTDEERKLVSRVISPGYKPTEDEMITLEAELIPFIKELMGLSFLNKQSKVDVPNVFEIQAELGHDELTVLQAIAHLDGQQLELLYKGYGKDFANTSNYHLYSQKEKLRVKNQIMPFIDKLCSNIENDLPLFTNIKEGRATIRERLKLFDEDIFNKVYEDLSEEDKILCEKADMKSFLTKEEERRRNLIIARMSCQARSIIQTRNNLRNTKSWNTPVLKLK